ncbi:FAD-dependent monooxygenase [Streptomonospora sp. PA3]|uniref:FAD-dependent oxidoreductase n=1 Tax=Streptomonospora sp. PA3 TaxID=2607326 RepID=UPI0012DEA9E5|nr:NAD(P)/FAD-dependent oxidoreductase [Streptomonospora sp. PA3]MUL41752.1 FAD-dependent monooxygenase [Streptomonospora sp. PA3]
MSGTRSALVIGGGIAGPVAALALQKAGIEAVVYEAHPSTADGIGGSLAIAPNGQAALEVVGARHAAEDGSVPISRSALSFGGTEVELPHLAGLPPMRLVQRAGLYRALHDLALSRGIRVEYGKRLVAADEGPGGVTARFADGTSAGADVLVGADGIHSAVRKLIDPGAPDPGHTGVLGLEGVADHRVGREPGSLNFAFGKRAYYLYWPLPDGRTGWGANLPQDGPMTLTEAREVRPEAWARRLREIYGDDDPGGRLVRSTPADRLQAAGSLHILPHVPHWHSDRMVLVGDAVHAPSNSSGQGASLAVESAVELARCLRDLPDAPRAFAAYERLRRPRVEKVAARAAKTNTLKAPGPAARVLMPVLMRLLLRTALRPERTFGAEQRYRIDWDAPVREPEPGAGAASSAAGSGR